MNITANCLSFIDGVITIRVQADTVYPQAVVQLSEYDILGNPITQWTNINQLNSTEQIFSYSLNINTKFVKIRLVSSLPCEDEPDPTPETCVGTLLIIAQEGQGVSSSGVSFNSSVDSSLCFTPSDNLSLVPSTFSIFVSNEEKASITFWGDYIGTNFVFTYNNIQYPGIFTSSNRIDF